MFFVLEAFSLGCEANHTLPFSIEVSTGVIILPFPINLDCLVLDYLVTVTNLPFLCSS
jgi:hypothetical protein